MRRVCTCVLAVAVVGCADINTDPAVPASIELGAQAFPSIAVGDSLRDTLGVARPLRALLRNLRGDVIEDAPVRFLSRDAALVVDSVTGHAFAVSRPSGGNVQVAARFEQALQALQSIRISREPDAVTRLDSARIDSLLADGTPGALAANRAEIAVRASWRDTAGAVQPSTDWLVRFAVVEPANPRNDTTAAVFLIDDVGRARQLDTTDTNGRASRFIRVRASLFPGAGVVEDTVVVEALVRRRGQSVPAEPLRIRVPVRRDALPAPIGGAVPSRSGGSGSILPG
jgi:hypothetical protein